MQIAIFGLGRMGTQIAKRLHKAGFEVFGWNRSAEPEMIEELEKAGVWASSDIAETAAKLSSQRVFWVMIPHANVEDFLQNQLGPHLKAGDIVIDGGNSFYKESIKRATELSVRGVAFYDCGTSGGVWGLENGFALMVGGPKEQWPVVEPIFKALSTGTNYGLVGENGAGHFVKMAHNGIEYGMMEAIAEGYGMMEASGFKLDLKQVTKIYQQGTVIRSWLVDLTADIFEKEDLASVKGEIAASGEAEWAISTAKELGVDVRVIEDSLNVRKESVDPKNQQKFSNKIVALLRKQFGGHSIKQ